MLDEKMDEKRLTDQTGKKQINGYIRGMVYMFIVLFMSLVLYLCYFTWKKAPELVNSPYNGRLSKLNDSCIRGPIASADGVILAQSELGENGKEKRVYPLDHTFSHVVGYTSVGETGLESWSSYYLLTSHESSWSKLYKELRDQKSMGDTMVTTLDSGLQKLVSDAMEGYEGACVVMDPTTGRILAMVSKPDFDPNTLEEDYTYLVSDSSNSNLVNRATQGLYSPGSTFKMVTALALMEQNQDWRDYSYYCQGSITVGDKTVRCSHGNQHGTVDVKKAFAKSCNSAFINIGLSLDGDEFRDTAEKLLFNRKIASRIPVAVSKFDLDSASSEWKVMQTSFGQGNTLITPLQNAMITSAIANRGVMMMPQLFLQVVSADGNVVENFEPEAAGSVMSADQAAALEEMMTEVVNTGTAEILQSGSYQAAAKTGSAQTDSAKETDAWLVAYAPAKDPQYVVSIVLEEAGAGSEAAGPIVKKIFDALLRY